MTKKELEIAKENYYANYNQFMMMWANDIREWTGCKDAIFYKDGVFDIDEWFSNKDFRPLFILKEVNEANKDEAEKEAQIHSENEIKKYGEKAAIKNCVDFVGTGNIYGSDPWNGERMWKRIGALAVALYKAYNNDEDIDYDNVNKIMSENVESGETLRQTVCRKIAIINLKKLGGGNNVESDKSKATLCFECHAKQFYKNLIEQITFIQPTVIICCGKDIVAKSLGLMDEKIKAVKKEIEIYSPTGKKQKIDVINGYHPSNQVKTENFYNKTIKELANRKLLPLVK